MFVVQYANTKPSLTGSLVTTVTKNQPVRKKNIAYMSALSHPHFDINMKARPITRIKL